MHTKLQRIAAALVAALLGCVGGAASARTEADAANATPAPFFNDANGPDAVVPQATTSTSVYLRVPGSAFIPRDSTTTFTYAGAGCVSIGAGGSILTTDVQIPQGATIQYVRTCYDNMGVSSSIYTFLTRYDGAGNYPEYTNFATTSTSGYGSDLSPLQSLAVDNAGYSYAVVINVGAADANLRFCGIRILHSP
jgi:hypothetical protein